MRALAARAGFALACGLAWVPAAQAASLRYCDAGSEMGVAQKAKLLRLSAVIKAELEASGSGVALVARSGLDLSRFGLRYSHAGFSLRDSPDTPWAVRQLYFSCEERQPRLFDQGLAGFLFGMDQPLLGYISVLLLPPGDGAAVAAAALDKPLALQLLGSDYSANAYPFATRYQNCNQWVAELLARAWGAAAADSAPAARQQAQAWLREQAYEPTRFEVGGPLMLVGSFVPWVHRSDHPEDDLAAGRYRVSMPDSLQAFVQRRSPGVQRLEFCHNEQHLVVHRGWQPIAEGCVPGPGDRVIALDD